eukprot:g4526.t1
MMLMRRVTRLTRGRCRHNRSITSLTTSADSTIAPINVGVAIVPEKSAWIVERFGRYRKLLEPGLHFLIPIVDSIRYVHSLKELVIPVAEQHAITLDNVTLRLDGVLYVQVTDPLKASYGVRDPILAVSQLAQTTMRSELGKLSLDDTFKERDMLNQNIVSAINSASKPWGLECLRYEIRDIVPPSSVRASMDLLAESERRKRADILTSEGEMQAEINVAKGQAKAISVKAEATSEALRKVAEAFDTPQTRDAVNFQIAQQYVSAFGKLAKEGTTVLMPSNPGDASSMVASALGIFQGLQQHHAVRPPFQVGDDNDDNIDDPHIDADDEFVPKPFN